MFGLLSCTGGDRDSRTPPVQLSNPAAAVRVSEAGEDEEVSLKLPWPKGTEPLLLTSGTRGHLQACHDLGAGLARVLEKREFSWRGWTESAEVVFPQLSLVWRMYAGNAFESDLEANPEAQVIYDYLFGTEERAEDSIKRLAALLCWSRLDEVWLSLYGQQADKTMVSWGICPQSQLAYLADANQLSCTTHGISLTFPDHNPRPALDEVMLQLCSGGFTAVNRRELDNLLFRMPLTAIKAGETVADVGCGVGGHTLTMSRAVGAKGHVIAVDTNSEVLKFVDAAKRHFAADNITTLRASDFDPGLKPDTLDKVFMIDLYDSLVMNDFLKKGCVNPRTDRYFYRLAAALKPNGKLIIVDKRSTQREWHLPASVVAGNCSKYGLRELKWYITDIGGVPKQVVVLQKDGAERS